MSFKEDPNEISALWEKTSARGRFLSGTINGVKVVVFHNDKKISEKAPDWRVLKSVPKNPEAPPREPHNANVARVPEDDFGF